MAINMEVMMVTITHLNLKDRHPYNGLFSGTNSVNWHQKGETVLNINEARDDGVAVASAGPFANHFHLAADR